ncbi:DUF3846 domain-containing protein [Oscillospiraceae bacterium 50-16]
MLILVVEPGKVPETQDISGNLKEMQSIVGGYIQAIYPFPGIALVCNEEGWLRGLPGNRGLRDENGEVNNIIWGTFFLCGVSADGEDFVGLTPEQAEQLEEQFHTPEAFVGSNGRIICVPFPARTFM